LVSYEWSEEKQLDIWRTELPLTCIWFGLRVAYPWCRKHQRLLLKVLTPLLQVYISRYSIVSARGCHVYGSLLAVGNLIYDEHLLAA
jgi:hypothetical protein